VSNPLRILGLWLAVFLGATMVLTLAVIALILQRQPLLSVESINPVKRHHETELIRGKLRSQAVAGLEKEFVLTADDLRAAAEVALSRKHLKGVAEVLIKGDQLDLQVSIRLPQHLSGLFLNIDLIVESNPDKAIIRQLKMGDLSLHSPLAGLAVKGIMKLPPLGRYGHLLEKMLMRVQIAEERVTILLKWNREFLAELGGLLTEVADRKRMIVYQEKLTDVLEADKHSRFVRLGHLVKPLFALAYERSLSNQQATEENRAALLVLSAYTNGKDLSSALGTSAQPPRRSVLLNRRADTAKHFMGAAAMAMSGQGTLVEMLGLAKELHDTHDGSGFSFIDLAADEAGAQPGKYAVRSSEMAFRIQERLSQGFDESPFIPTIDDLPESMNAEEFAHRFKAIGSPEYEALRREINARIMALPIFQFRKIQ